jgi:hypothetical protein
MSLSIPHIPTFSHNPSHPVGNRTQSTAVYSGHRSPYPRSLPPPTEPSRALNRAAAQTLAAPLPAPSPARPRLFKTAAGAGGRGQAQYGLLAQLRKTTTPNLASCAIRRSRCSSTGTTKVAAAARAPAPLPRRRIGGCYTYGAMDAAVCSGWGPSTTCKTQAPPPRCHPGATQRSKSSPLALEWTQ